MSLRVLKWCIIGFFSLSITITILYTFMRPPFTFLMIKRQIEYRNEKNPPKFRHNWISIKNISPYLVLAVVASEDNNFTHHFGIDLEAIKDAEQHNKRHRRKHGASTISQQTAKNVFLWPSRTYIRKGFELYFTFLIETFWSKKRIMEIYLNSIEMGPNIYGAEAASQYYFHKPASKLSRAEAALIAVSLPNPRYRNPAKPSGYMLTRQQHILYLMKMIGQVDL